MPAAAGGPRALLRQGLTVLASTSICSMSARDHIRARSGFTEGGDQAAQVHSA